MTKYDTMQECFDACGDDDYPFNAETDFNIHRMATKKELMSVDILQITPNNLKSTKFQIKRAEPKVLSVDEIVKKATDWTKTTSSVSHDNEIEYHNLLRTAERGDKNGQLREWKRPEQEQLRTAVQKFLKIIGQGPKSPEIIEMIRTFGNLKPPYEND